MEPDVSSSTTGANHKDISIHGLRMEPDTMQDMGVKENSISIHGLRMEPDISGAKDMGSEIISIHGLRMEPDDMGGDVAGQISDFNPRAPYGARHPQHLPLSLSGLFQSTGSVWSPTVIPAVALLNSPFQSTGSVWSPTPYIYLLLLFYFNFNPRAPYGARRGCVWTTMDLKLFQSTGSVWSPTTYMEDIIEAIEISIHGLRVEPDFKQARDDRIEVISIHGLRVEPDRRVPFFSCLVLLFQSTGSVWSPTS